MLRLVIFLTAIITISALSADTLQRLRRTKELNFTFYYDHTYPEPEELQISLEFSMKTSILVQAMQTLNSSINAITDLAKRYNATVVLDPLKESKLEIVQILLAEKYKIYSLISLSINPDKATLHDLLGELVSQNKNLHTKLIMIEWVSLKKFDEVAEQAKALEGATQRGKHICEQYLNMKLKGLSIFKKHVQDQQSNKTSEQGQGFKGSYLQVINQAEQEQLVQSATLLNQIYQCQIICENNIHFVSDSPSKKINSKLAQQKASQKSSPTQQKQKDKASSKPLKKGKTINPQKYQRNRRDQL